MTSSRSHENSVSFIERTVEKTHVLLKDVSVAIGVDDRHVAYLVLRSVLHALRDRLDVEGIGEQERDRRDQQDRGQVVEKGGEQCGDPGAHRA